MELDFKDNRGFTLVEIAIVMFIIGVMSTLAVNGYTQYRRSALLDFSADTLVAQVVELRGRSDFGDFGEGRFNELRGELEGVIEELEEMPDSAATCFGLYFAEFEGEFVGQSFTQEFKNKQVWDVIKQGWVYEGCGSFDPNAAGVELRALEFDPNVQILGIGLGRGDNLVEVNNDFVMRFTPPGGIVEFKADAQNFREAQSVDEQVSFVLKYGVSDEARYKRRVFYKFLSEAASIKFFE